VKFGLNAKGEGDVGACDVAAAEAESDREVETVESAEDGFFEQFRGGRGSAVEHLAKDDADDAVEFAGVAQLPDHAVDLMRLCAGVFDEKKLAFGLGLPGGTEESNEDAEAAAIEGSMDDSARGLGFDQAEPFSGADAIRLAGERGQEAGHVDTVFAVEVGRDHGAVEGRKAELIEQVELDGGEVAVAEERLGVPANELKVEAGEQVVGFVAAADGCDERCVGVQECAVEVIEAMAGRSGEEDGSALESVGSKTRLKAEFAETVEPFFDVLLVGIGGGREYGDAGA